MTFMENLSFTFGPVLEAFTAVGCLGLICYWAYLIGEGSR
jgi:hypothetical protein